MDTEKCKKFTIKELITELNSYPPDTEIALKDKPDEEVELRVRSYKDCKGKITHFVSIE